MKDGCRERKPGRAGWVRVELRVRRMAERFFNHIVDARMIGLSEWMCCSVLSDHCENGKIFLGE
jgi:hypothetical protein